MKIVLAATLAIGMVATTLAAVELKPTPLYTPGQKPAVSLESLVPTQFGDWVMDTSGPRQIISPGLTAELERIYTETVTRTYVDSNGNRVMLSLAYGADQSRSMQIHKPEVCYEAQGFKITRTQRDELPMGNFELPLMRLTAMNGPRKEPITYWIRTGDFLVRGWLEQNVTRVKNGLIKGVTPDGILVRISTIDTDTAHAYKVHDAFINDMLRASSVPGKEMMLGELSKKIM